MKKILWGLAVTSAITASIASGLTIRNHTTSRIQPLSQESAVEISSKQPGIGLEDPETLLIALPLINNGSGDASNVEITSIKLQFATLASPATLPQKLGNLPAKRSVIVESTFSSKRFIRYQSRVLEVSGNFVNDGRTLPFSIRRSIVLPPAAPGSSKARTAQAAPHTVSGARFQIAPARAIPAEVNELGPPVPTGRRRGNMTPSSEATTIGTARPFVPGDDPPGDFVFLKNTSFGSPAGIPNDPSVSNGGPGRGNTQTVLATGNTYGSFSVNGGDNFNGLNPSAIFPNTDAVGNLIDGGLCCDQIVHYSPAVNRYFWLMLFRAGSNGQNRLRIASASPQALISSGGTSWTFWDMTSSLFNLGNNVMDYPDLSVGDNYLYVSVDGNGGLLVARIPLTELRDSTTIHIDYTSPADGVSAYGRHLVQNPGDGIFWAGQPSNSLMRFFSWKEGTNIYSWNDIAIASYPNSDYSSTSPDGSNWLSSMFYTGPGGTRISGTNRIWFAWTGARGGGFPNPHIQLALIDFSNFSLVQQTQIWNSNIAFGFASLITNSNNTVGISLAFGGGSFFGTPAMGILGDLSVFAPCQSTSNAGRYGDYSTVRDAFPNPLLFSAAGYCVSPNSQFDPHYVLFGRAGDVNPPAGDPCAAAQAKVNDLNDQIDSLQELLKTANDPEKQDLLKQIRALQAQLPQANTSLRACRKAHPN